ncbi:Regulator Of G-Protein Signaling 11 [Manis pentadactyla]|nr:Regulator Of G-Protein Signaling 11 [Manis pentadactyla]
MPQLGKAAPSWSGWPRSTASQRRVRGSARSPELLRKAPHLGALLLRHGCLHPLREHRSLGLRPDDSPCRFQPGVPSTLEQGPERSSCTVQWVQMDSYPRFLKSDVYKGLLAEAVVPPETRRRVTLLGGTQPPGGPEPAPGSPRRLDVPDAILQARGCPPPCCGFFTRAVHRGATILTPVHAPAHGRALPGHLWGRGW